MSAKFLHAYIMAKDALNSRLLEIGGCSDGSCIVIRPKGMHTNGGCRCSRDHIKMQRLAYAYRKFDEALADASRR